MTDSILYESVKREGEFKTNNLKRFWAILYFQGEQTDHAIQLPLK